MSFAVFCVFFFCVVLFCVFVAFYVFTVFYVLSVFAVLLVFMKQYNNDQESCTLWCNADEFFQINKRSTKVQPLDTYTWICTTLAGAGPCLRMKAWLMEHVY